MSRARLGWGAAITAALVLGCGGSRIAIEPAGNPAAGFAESADPALAADSATGDLLLAFVARGADSTWRLYFSRSTDGGATWSPARVVTEQPGEVKPHGEASARLVTAPDGRVALVWSQDFKVEGRKWPASRIRFSRSLDGGATWSPAVTLNDDTTAADAPRGHTFHGAAGDGKGGIAVAWLDERKGGDVTHDHAGGHQHDATAESDATIYLARSDDFGATWSGNRPLWGAVCPCCRVTLATRPGGAIAATWRKHYPGDVRDVVTAELPDAGDARLPEPERVHEDGWVFPGCPHTGPALSIGEDGTRHVAWYTGRPGGAGVFLAREGAHGGAGAPVALVQDSTLPTAHAAVLALPDGGTLAAWDIGSRGARGIQVARVAAGATRVRAESVPGSEAGSHPQLARTATGSVLLAFTRIAGAGAVVELVRVR
ncbi:MAG TPA: sialidase family protein [Gemmatimonadales bacterium]|nr:sialidase family protein [Gemmatimonadales bacterium]